MAKAGQHGVLAGECFAVLRHDGGQEEADRRLGRSLIATVHGHCAVWLSGSYALLRDEDPAGQALARVIEALSAHRG